MTVHWINPKDFRRHNAVLCCKRVVGSITFDILIQLITEVLKYFSIEFKTTAIVTDNGSNFIKAFGYRISLLFSFYSILNNLIEQSESSHSFDFLQETNADHPDPFDNISEDDLEFIDIHALIEENLDRWTVLPPHYRCAAHGLNLVLKDCKKIDDFDYQDKFHAVFQKLKTFWNFQSRGHADTIKEFVNTFFPIPIDVRWHTYVDAVEKVVQVGQNTVNDICKAVYSKSKNAELIVFTVEDFEFLKEYYEVSFAFQHKLRFR